MTSDDRNRLVLFAFIALILIAGANAVAVRFTLRELAPFWSASFRFVSGSAVFFLIMALRKVRFPSGRALAGDVLYGILGFGLSYALFYWGVQDAPAGVAQVLLALAPLGTVFLAALHGIEKVTARGVAGAILALAGFVVVFRDQLSANVPLPSLIALLIAPFVVAETTVIVKWFPRTNPVGKNAIGMLSGAAFLFVLSMLNGETLAIPRSAETWTALVYLVLPGSVLVFTLFLYVLNRWTASASSYQFVLLPFVTVFYGMILLDERVSALMAIGAILVIAGVYVGGVISGPEKKKREVDVIPCLPEQTPTTAGTPD